MEYKYSINLNTRNPIMLLDQQIGLDADGTGIDASQFMRELLSLDQIGFDDITIMINSYGGYVSEGQQIFTAILNCKTKIKTQVMGVAASIAAVIFEAGAQRVVYDYSVLMFHPPLGGSEESLVVFKEAIMAMCAKTKLPKKKISEIMDNETWMNGNDPKYFGTFWDLMLETGKVSNKVEIDMVMNSARELIDQIKNDNDMDIRIKEKLDLPIDSTDDEVLAKIDELKVKNEVEIEITTTEDKPEMAEFTIKNNLKISFECFETGKPVFTTDEAGNLTPLAPGTYDFLDEERVYTYSRSFIINEIGEIEQIIDNESRTEKAMNITIDKLIDVLNIEVKNEDIEEALENITDIIVPVVEETIEEKITEENIIDEINTIQDEEVIIDSKDEEIEKPVNLAGIDLNPKLKSNGQIYNKTIDELQYENLKKLGQLRK